jgi:hypothetical protein
MPYFYNNDINILFIHIPKTGGSSVEVYLSKKYNIKLNLKSLWDMKKINYNFKFDHDKISPQHQIYNTLFKYRNEFNINFNDNLKIITIVRNPYDRIISDFFWSRLITINSTKEEVFKIMYKYVHNNPNIYDNHNIPQYKFITDDDNNIINNIIILKTETLNNDMKNIGYNDFNLNILKNKLNINYNDYLNDNSINVINSFYEKDFKLFNYNMKNI